MSRILLAVPPLSGHLNPATALAAELTRRGHQVSWVGSEAVLRPVLGPDAVVHPTGSRILREQSGHGAAAIASLWQRFLVPYTKFTLPAVQRAVDAARPDVVLADQQMFAGALVAHRTGLPWASLVCTTMELARPFRDRPAVEAELFGHLDTVRRLAGVTGVDPRFSPHLVLALTSPELSGPPPPDLPSPPAYVGPLLGARPPVPGFAVPATDRPLVLVSTGTLADDLAAGFLHRALAALRTLDVAAVVVAPPGVLPDPPPGVTVAARVPVLDLLPRLSAVLTHGGLNTVTESLAHGVPLVVAPIRHDQPLNARQVAAAGAGVRVSFARAEPARIAAALAAVLDGPAHRTAAERIRASFVTAGGVPAAAGQVERMARSGPNEQEPLSDGTARP